MLRAAMVAVPALVVVAGASSIVTLAVAGSDNTVASGSGRPASGSGAKAHTTVGTVTGQDGSSWSLRTASGRTVTIHLAPSTTFGTKSHPSSADAFHTGTTVRVLGAVKGASVDATRIVERAPAD